MSTNLSLSILAGTALGLAHGAAIAGPYVNVESNSGFSGNDYSSTLLETHLGYEGSINDASWYIQGGPAVSFPDDASSTGAASGKVGGSVAVTTKTDVYGELSAATSEGLDTSDLSVGAKLGMKYKF
jgi:hypothetical protein